MCLGKFRKCEQEMKDEKQNKIQSEKDRIELLFTKNSNFEQKFSEKSNRTFLDNIVQKF